MPRYLIHLVPIIYTPPSSTVKSLCILVFVRIIASGFSRPLFDSQVFTISAPADSFHSNPEVCILFLISARSYAYARNSTPTGRVSRSSQSYRIFHKVGPRIEPCETPLVYLLLPRIRQSYTGVSSRRNSRQVLCRGTEVYFLHRFPVIYSSMKLN